MRGRGVLDQLLPLGLVVAIIALRSPLIVNDMVQAGLNLVELKWIEAETCAARLNGLNDLVDVVANDAWRSVTERCGGTVSKARNVAA